MQNTSLKDGVIDNSVIFVEYNVKNCSLLDKNRYVKYQHAEVNGDISCKNSFLRSGSRTRNLLIINENEFVDGYTLHLNSSVSLDELGIILFGKKVKYVFTKWWMEMTNNWLNYLKIVYVNGTDISLGFKSGVYDIHLISVKKTTKDFQYSLRRRNFEDPMDKSTDLSGTIFTLGRNSTIFVFEKKVGRRQKLFYLVISI